MNLSEFNDKIEDVKSLLGEVSKDITDLLTMTQMTGPIIQGTIKKVKDRVIQVEKIFSGNETVQVEVPTTFRGNGR